MSEDYLARRIKQLEESVDHYRKEVQRWRKHWTEQGAINDRELAEVEAELAAMRALQKQAPMPDPCDAEKSSMTRQDEINANAMKIALWCGRVALPLFAICAWHVTQPGDFGMAMLTGALGGTGAFLWLLLVMP